MKKIPKILIAFIIIVISLYLLIWCGEDSVLSATDEPGVEEIIEPDLVVEEIIIEESSTEELELTEEIELTEELEPVEEPVVEELIPELIINLWYREKNDGSLHYGDTVHIDSFISGFQEPISYQWQYSSNGDIDENYIDIPGANEPIFSFILDEVNCYYWWRLRVDDGVNVAW